MYRAAGYYFVTNNIDLTNENIEANLDKLNIDLKYNSEGTIVYLNGEDITSKIRTEEISMAASDVSKNKKIREKLVALQRKMAEGESVVLEGRDITTVVFPNADLKLFLTASIEIRAIRRKRDLAKKGQEVDTEDAVVIDTTSLTNDETVDMVIKLLNERI